MAKSRSWLKDILTDYDNRTYDTGRSFAAIYLAVAIGLEIYRVVYSAQPFDVKEFLLGGAAFFVGVGIAIAGDNHNRPKGSSERIEDTIGDHGANVRKEG